MVSKILVLALLVCICAAQSQLGGCGGPGPILPRPLPTPFLGAGVGSCAGPLPTPLNSPISVPCSTPTLPTNTPGLVNFPAPLAPLPLTKASYLPPTLPPLSPPVITPVAATPTNVIATTVIDNSVANSLANTLQLLIVSNLIQSTLNSGAPSLLAGDVIDTVATSPFDIVSSLPEILSNIDVYGSSVFEANPYFYGGITEVVTPVNVEPFTHLYGGLPEFVTPLPVNVGPFGGVPTNLYGGLSELVSTFPPYYGLPEFNPIAASLFNCIPPAILPAFPMQVSEVISPLAPLSLPPNFYNGMTEIANPTSRVPVAAEILIPSSIPAQLTCNLGYLPASLPVVTVNVEPLPYNDFGLGNGYLC